MTPAHVIDLAAVARVRAELAVLVAEHPSLTSPDAQARLAATLPELSMPPRLNPDTTDDTVIIGVRMTPEMRDALDAEVKRQRALNPDVTIRRSNVLRGILRRALLTPAGATATLAVTPALSSHANVTVKPLPPPEEPAVAVKPRTARPRTVKSLPLLETLSPRTETTADAPEHSDGLDTVDALRAALVAEHQAGASFRTIARGCGCSDIAVRRFLDGTTASMPKWADGARGFLGKRTNTYIAE